MAVKNTNGLKISYNCDDLIYELKKDIKEFGSDLKLYVVTEKMRGAKIYKEYNFYNGKGIGFKLNAAEHLEVVKANELLKLYEKQNAIL